MKKIVSLLLVLVMVVSLGAFSAAAEGTVKVGLITLHDENSTYDLKAKTAMKSPATWPMTAATSFLLTASAMKTI